MSAALGLRRIVSALDGAGIEHMLAGSHASGFHGLPRTTHDFDIVIDADAELLTRLVGELRRADYYVSEEAALDALRRRSMFNVVDNVTGWKSDLVILPRDDFARTQWDRREKAQILGVSVTVATAEDTILSKLSWARRSGSERQLQDVAGIVAVQGAALDRAYVERWTERLGVTESWARVLASLPPN